MTVRTILAAVAFLTRIPVRAPSPMPASFGAAAFGLAGAGLGLVAGIPLLALGARVPLVAALLALAVLAGLSGALHLDGLADTADALAAPDPEGAERARRDPAIGAAGATALVLVLGLEAAALAALVSVGGGVVATVAFVVAVAWGRAIGVVVAVAPGRRAPDGGLATGFVAAVRRVDGLLAVAVPLALAVAAQFLLRTLWGSPAIWIGLIAGAVLAGLVVVVRGRLDGDALGATIQVGEAATLVACAATLTRYVGPPG